jgi:hypothetical protein
MAAKHLWLPEPDAGAWLRLVLGLREGGRGRKSKGNVYRLGRFMRGLHTRRDEPLDGPLSRLPVAELLSGDSESSHDGPPPSAEAGLQAARTAPVGVLEGGPLDELPASIKVHLASCHRQ